MFELEHKEYLIFLVLIPIIYGIFVYRNYMRRKSITRIGDTQLVEQLLPDYSGFRKRLKFALSIIVMALVIIAIAGPRFGTKLTTVKREGFDLIIALDVSNSMMADDIKPNRLERAKQELSQLIDRLGNDRIGLIVFAGDAFTQIPITNDFLSAKMFLSGINTGMVSRQGTDIGEAINLAVKSFSQESKAGKAIIVISDGEDHEGGIDEACKNAEAKKIRIFTIGMGTSVGSRIPVIATQNTRDYQRDRDGNFIVTRLNEKMLADIAEKGGGRYYRANMPNMGLNNMLEELNKLNKVETESSIYAEFDEKFEVFMWIVFALLLIDFLIDEKRSKIIRKIRLFKIN